MTSNPTARRRFLGFLAASPLLSLDRREAEAVIAEPAQAINVFDFEAAARKVIAPAHFGYLATGVEDDRTVRENHEAYSRIRLRPRRLLDVSRIDTTIDLFGTKWPSPIFFCPCGSQKAFHPDGELATARAGATHHTLQLLSTLSTVSLEDVIRAATRPVWQQLYPTSNWLATETIVKRAETAGSPVLVITVDVPSGRKTETEARARADDSRPCVTCHRIPVFSGRKPMLDGIDLTGTTLFSPAFTWESVQRVRKLTKMKIVLKGIQTAEDAKLACEYGVDGLVVSNHGGRAEESGRASIDCLPEIVDSVRGSMPVMIDGGIRRGTDVFKALALGASAVGIGRPYLWGLGAFGQAGVERVIDILRTEFAVAMAQCGTRSIHEIKSTSVLLS